MENIVSYIIPGEHLDERVGSRQFQIWNTKQEVSFQKFADKSSPQFKLAFLASEDPLLRILFFLESSLEHWPYEDFPLRVKFPIVLKYDEDFRESLAEELPKKQIESIKTRGNSFGKDWKSFATSSMARLFQTFLSDHEIRRSIASGRIPRLDKEFDKMTDRAISRQKEKFERMAGDLTELMGKGIKLMEEEVPILTAYDSFETAIKNMEKISYAIDLQTSKDLLADSLSKITTHRIFRVVSKSICMECRLRRSLEPYSLLERYGGRPAFPLKCTKCPGETVLHELTLEADPSFATLLEENLLQEVLIGFSVAGSKMVKKVYIHKKIHPVENGEIQAGRQIDVFTITNDDKIVAIEVTTKSDWNHIIQEEKEKEKILEQIPCDYLIYVTGALGDRYLPIDDRTYVLSAKHIPEIEQLFEKIISGKPPHKTVG